LARGRKGGKRRPAVSTGLQVSDVNTSTTATTVVTSLTTVGKTSLTDILLNRLERSQIDSEIAAIWHEVKEGERKITKLYERKLELEAVARDLMDEQSGTRNTKKVVYTKPRKKS